jgi:hypothetical protein
MSRARALLLAFVGLLLPVGLALGVYVASAGSLTAVPTVVQPPVKIARAATTTETQQATESTPTTTRGDDDLPGKCKDPEHQLDPDCDPRSAAEDDGDDDSSGPGSGSDDDGDSSGPGSGGDDRGGDSSGPGSGDDD